MIDLGLKPAVHEEMVALLLLDWNLHKLANSNNGHMSDTEFCVEWDKICEVH